MRAPRRSSLLTLFRPGPLLALGVLATAQLASAEEAPLALAQLVSRARAADLRVAEADAELQVLQAKYQQALWAWFPRFDTTIAAGGPTPEARNNGLGGPPTTPATLMYDSNFGQIGLTVRAEMNAFLPIFTFGKLKALREAGEKGVTAGEALRERVREEAGLQAAQAFYAFQLARLACDAFQDTLRQLESSAKLVEELLKQESAQVTVLDRYKLNFFRRQLEGRIAQAAAGMDIAAAAAGVLVASKGPIRLAEADFPNPPTALPVLEPLVEAAQTARAEVRALDAAIEARERELTIRERSFYPDLGLFGFARFAYTTNATRQLSPFAYDPYNDLSGGVALVLRGSFDIPQKIAQLNQTRGELQKMRTQRSLLASAVGLEVRRAHAGLSEAVIRARTFAEAERSARQWATAAYANFEVGTGDTRELVDAFSALAQASGERLKSWHDVHVGLREMARFVGQEKAQDLVRD
ncbi:MAG: TolC family protein [Myxococcaceae bacterium]